ncbi:hypothetical protein D3C76_1877880 [compost metagenome]
MRIFFDCENLFFLTLEFGQNVKTMNANQIAILLETWVSEEFIRGKVIDSVIQIGWVRKAV